MIEKGNPAPNPFEGVEQDTINVEATCYAREVVKLVHSYFKNPGRGTNSLSGRIEDDNWIVIEYPDPTEVYILERIKTPFDIQAYVIVVDESVIINKLRVHSPIQPNKSILPEVPYEQLTFQDVRFLEGILLSVELAVDAN